MREALAESLGRAGFAVTLAATPSAARRSFHARPTQVVIFDQALADGAGTDFLAELREHHPDVDRFLLASPGAAETAMERVDSGAFARVFQKPLVATDVAIGVGESLQRRELLDEARSHRASTWGEIAGTPVAVRDAQAKPLDAAELPADPEQLAALMRACLAARGGEVSARRAAARLGRGYLEAGAPRRRVFLHVLAEELAIDGAAVDAAIDTYRRATDEAAQVSAEAHLRGALLAPRRRLLTQFNSLPDGVKFLVDLRADLANLCSATPRIGALDADLRQLLASWFDPGFLDLRRITWDSPAALLEKLIAYEAVHEIRSWSDLRNRLSSVGRCYALFHPRMPAEPLVFVEVALCAAIATSVQGLIDSAPLGADPDQATAAVFYSISNTQAGLRGIRFGDVLIRRVVRLLTGELPRLRAFVTLSPLPDMRDWLARHGTTARLAPLLTKNQRAQICALAGNDDLAVALELLLAQPAWHEHAAVCDVLERPLRRIALAYLVARRENGEPVDRVARFHLKNGARLARINWLGDTSQPGLFRSFGLMVNYSYVRADLERNHESYAERQTIILDNELATLADKMGLAFAGSGSPGPPRR